MYARKTGFTLIEILIVVAIISILATVVIVGLSPQQQSGRDAQRVADLSTIQNDLELYLNECGFYPGGANCSQGATTGFSDMAAAVVNPAVGVNASSVPFDPLNKAPYVFYFLTNGTPATAYVVGTELENANSPEFQNYHPISLSGFTTGDRTLTSCQKPFYCVTMGGVTLGGIPTSSQQSNVTSMALSATAVSETEIDLAWGSVGNATAYKVFQNGFTLTTTGQTSYDDTGLIDDTTYNFIVAAYDANGNVIAESKSVQATTQSPQQQAPTVGTLVTANMIGLDDENTGYGWPAAPANIGVLRLWDDGLWWDSIDPNCTAVNTTNVVNWLNAAAMDKVPIVTFTFGDPPDCAYSAPGVISPIAETQFIDAITQLSTARKTLGERGIDYYEPINEPQNATSGGGAGIYQAINLATYMQLAYKLIKQNDPGTLVVGPTIAYAPGFKWYWYGTDGYLAAAQTLNDPNYPFYDIQSYHDYLGSFSTSIAPEAGVLQGIDSMKSIMQQYGIGNMPLINTEFSWDDPTGVGAANWAYEEQFLARSYIMFMANDTGMWWYGWGYSGGWGSLYNNSASPGSAYPPATAYQVVTGWLMGSTIGSVTTSGTTYSVPITLANGKTGLLLWNTAGNSTYALPSSLQGKQYEDAMGNTGTAGATAPIGLLPILITD